jgi:ketosteroid isomerase-like protein
MSRESLEVVRSGFEALSQADFDTMRELLHPEAEWHDQWDLPGSSVHVGVEAVLRHFESITEDLADFRTDLETFDEAPDGRVVASCRIRGVGRGSGAPVERPAVVVFSLRGGRIARGEIFASKREALEAVGLSEYRKREGSLGESANLDLVRSIYAAWERGDFSSAEWAHPEIEYVTVDGPSPGSSTGLAAMAEGMRDFLSAWEDWRVEAEEYRELDGGRVLVPFRFSARGKTSGLDVGQMRTKGASLFHVRGGKVTRLVQYFDRERALADLNSASEAGSPHS